VTVETVFPRTRDEWLSLRVQTIGASESSALLGVNPFKTAFQLFHEKTGTAEKIAETPAMKRGRLLEDDALELLAEERPEWKIEPNPIPGGRVYRNMEHRLSCTPDAFVTAPGRGLGICQVKTTNSVTFRNQWKIDGEVECPTYIAVQAIQEAHLTGAEWACVLVLVFGDFTFEPHVIDIPLHAGIMDKLRKAAADFWRRVAEKDAPDPDYGRDARTIASLYADDDGSEADLSGNERIVEILAERASLKDIESAGSAAEKKRKALDAEIIQLLQNAARGRLADGTVIEAKTVHRKGFTVEPSQFRTVKVKAKGSR
jgi:putative phage-type endonuclease